MQRAAVALPCIKKISALLTDIKPKNKGDFYCMNYLHSFRRKIKIESHKTVCENKDFCYVVIPSEDTKILEFSQFQKSYQDLFTTHADLECIIEKIDYPLNLSTIRGSKHIRSGFSMSAISSFRSIEENKHDIYRGKYRMKKFREFLKSSFRSIENKHDVCRGNYCMKVL